MKRKSHEDDEQFEKLINVNEKMQVMGVVVSTWPPVLNSSKYTLTLAEDAYEMMTTIGCLKSQIEAELEKTGGWNATDIVLAFNKLCCTYTEINDVVQNLMAPKRVLMRRASDSPSPPRDADSALRARSADESTLVLSEAEPVEPPARKARLLNVA